MVVSNARKREIEEEIRGGVGLTYLLSLEDVPFQDVCKDISPRDPDEISFCVKRFKSIFKNKCARIR